VPGGKSPAPSPQVHSPRSSIHPTMTHAESLPRIVAAFAEAVAVGDFPRAEGWLAVAWLAASRVTCDHVESTEPRCTACMILGPLADPRRQGDGKRQ
jgi:hypothetical protein